MGARGARRKKSGRESSLTWTTWLDLNNRSRSAFEISLAPVNTLLRVHARAHQTERSSFHKTQMDERDARYDNAVRYTTVLNEIPLAANEINSRTRLIAKKSRGKTPVIRSTGVKFEAHNA